MRIAVIVVNYGTADLAIEAVESVLNSCDSPTCTVYLVDNASPGDDASRLSEKADRWGSRVRFWPEKVNHGFGRGNNLILQALDVEPEDERPKYVLLLNPDAVVLGDAIAQLAHALTENPKAAAVGAAIRNSSGELAVSAFRFPTWISEVTRVIDFGPLKRLTRRHWVPLPAALPRQEVDWVSGSAVMFRFHALKAVGFFDPGFFLYYEEVDLMRRLRDAGWTVLHVPEAEVIHHAGAATGLNSDGPRRRNPRYVYDSWTHYFRQCFGRWRALGLALLLLVAGALNVILFGLRGRRPTLPEKFFRDHIRHAIRPLVVGAAR
jgi:GT2 family glycosyltransferase